MALVLKVRAMGMEKLDLSPVDLRFILASLASIWLCIETPTARLRKSHGVGPGHLLQDGDEEADLHLSGMLQKSVKSGCALGFGENFEP